MILKVLSNSYTTHLPTNVMHKADDFKRLVKRTSDTRLSLRYLAPFQFKSGHNRTNLAKNLGVARGSVNTWISSYLSERLAGLQDNPHSGRTCKLSLNQLDKLKHFIETNAIKSSSGRLIADDIDQYIATEFHVHYKPVNIYRLMHQLGLSWITSRSKYLKQSQASQNAFKKLPYGNDPYPGTFIIRAH